ncbi:glycine betaine ABC transporter substrate-binding protein [Natronogracilivirga saccharolytica]|uniref:Glycine betaine ABC transporter substrate-binding protein n=1 Tax=Natronogracilivirga saccharolytica TaxID=2812953 RepID=A0A8J7UVR3_9BACT|nr:glycine betaine ABC transporter substrate-binding protein [Natronogracilivirga saccharolytica]MBP3191439.1 glycine betaine ABC transporter substrate-binding protein [Natronogracilivirga saccharolytica]
MRMLNATSNWKSGWTAMIVAVAALVGLQACEPAEREVELGYVQWDSEIASTHVVASVIQDELGHDVNLTAVDAGPMFTGMARGDFDAIVAAWLPGTHEAYMAEIEDDVLNLGPNLEGAKIGWVVPDYIPVNSIDELNDYVDEFGGEITGIDPGAGLMAASEDAIEEYELNFDLVSGSDAAMTAALDRAIQREEWIVVTGWTPHWKFAAHDLKYLEDPLNVFGDAEHIATLVTPDLEERLPDVYAFLDNFYWTPEEMGEVMVYIEEGMEPYDAARQWISENQDRVQEWLGN